MGNLFSKTKDSKEFLEESKTKDFEKFLEEKILQWIYPSPDVEVMRTSCRRPIRSAPHNVSTITLVNQPVEGDERVLGPIDRRSQVEDPARWPHSVHGVVSFRINNIPYSGTGTLIGPNVVLTAGHNIYNHRERAYSDLESMLFAPGINGDIAPFNSVKIEKYFVSPNYIQDAEREDYAILILKEKIGEYTGYFGLACLKSDDLREKRVNVTGYPGDKVRLNPGTHEMWGMEGPIVEVNEVRGEVNYDIDTYAGQSGSGVWYQEGEDYYVCAVHIRFSQNTNKATLLTRDIYKHIFESLKKGETTGALFSLGDRTRLDFPNLEINAECMSLLMKYNLYNLTSLDLQNKHFGIQGAKALAENTSWNNLSELNLSSNDIGAEGLKALAENVSWINLSILDLSNNNIDGKGAGELAKNKSWVHLSTLNLSNNKLGDIGAKELAKNDSWKMLAKLLLSQNKITSKGEKELAKNPYWIHFPDLILSTHNLNVGRQ